MEELVKEAPVLQLFVNNKPVMIQCDATQNRLGAALLQALTDSETRYAHIEKELLAIVFSVEKFDQFTFGRTVHVQSDHKPFE